MLVQGDLTLIFFIYYFAPISSKSIAKIVTLAFRSVAFEPKTLTTRSRELIYETIRGGHISIFFFLNIFHTNTEKYL